MGREMSRRGARGGLELERSCGDPVMVDSCRRTDFQTQGHAKPTGEKPDVTVGIVMCQCGFVICNKRPALVVSVMRGGCA